MNEVLIEKPADGIALVRINRPEVRNALNAAVRAQINEAFNSFDTDSSVLALSLIHI